MGARLSNSIALVIYWSIHYNLYTDALSVPSWSWEVNRRALSEDAHKLNCQIVERDQEPLAHGWEADLEPSVLESCVDMVLGICHRGEALAQKAMFRQMLLGEVTSEKKVFCMEISVTCFQR